MKMFNKKDYYHIVDEKGKVVGTARTKTFAEQFRRELKKKLKENLKIIENKKGGFKYGGLN